MHHITTEEGIVTFAASQIIEVFDYIVKLRSKNIKYTHTFID